MGGISKDAQCERERKTLFWGGSRQGSRGGNDQESQQGRIRVQEGEQAQAGDERPRRREALRRVSISLRGGVRPPRTLQTPAAESRARGP